VPHTTGHLAIAGTALPQLPVPRVHYIVPKSPQTRHVNSNAAAARGSRPARCECLLLTLPAYNSNRRLQADFLDDKLQTLPDLESLDALLVSVRNQHVLLRKQVISYTAAPVESH
jgi:hypothetical protein